MTLPDKIRDLPCWTGTPSGAPLSGGLSNEIWKVSDDTGDHVVRFGTDYPMHHVDRARELMSTRAAHAAGFSPAVEYAAQGVMVTAFVPSRTWEAADMRANPDRMADLLHRFHTTMAHHISGTAHFFWVFHVIRDYARTLAEGKSRFAADLPRFLDLSQQMEAAQVPLPIVFAHNDLLPANILEDDTRLWLIDYEYAGYSTPMFDLAGVASNSEMGPEAAQGLLTCYFGAAPDAALLRAFDAMQCVSLLREAMWAMVSELHLNAPGVDYVAYAHENLDRLRAATDRYHSLYGKDVS
jgi:thiamine kinase-like enzyme